MRHRTGELLLIVALVALVVALPSFAFAFNEPNDMPGLANPANCVDCHFTVDYQDYIEPCRACHAAGADSPRGFNYYEPWGPHGGYLNTTSRCGVCHSVHAAPNGSVSLLPASTVYGACFTCHDGTGGWGVYGTILQRTGSEPAAKHSFNGTNVVPGGDATTGGSSTAVAFRGAGGTLTCSDCHSPHGVDVVAGFVGDRMRLRQSVPNYTTSRLLKQTPTGADTAAGEYGSDWCLGCHKGRNSDSMTVHNHPVETVVSAAPLTAFIYRSVARLASDEATSVTEIGTLGGLTTRGDNHWDYPPQVGADNRGFLMPYPRTAQQAGHLPICQQCHEDARSVGALTGDGSIGDANPTVVEYADAVTWDGTAWVNSVNDNPRFQNFPHETANDNMLVETGDDLCLNCHPSTALP
jgi:hypothetical protein